MMTTSQERTDIMKFKRYMAVVTALCVCAAFAGCGNSSSESSSIAENSIYVTESVSESSTSEMVGLFTNLIDNAIEACLHLPESARWISAPGFTGYR